MKRILCLLAMAFVMSMSASAATMFRPVTHKLATEGHGPKVRVLLAKEVNSALIEAKGAYRVVNKSDGTILSSGPIGKRYVLHALQKGLRWGEDYPDVYELTIKPLNEESTLFVNGVQYKGALSIYRALNGRISVINEVPIENFLTSLLSIKYDVPLAKEAIAALTILERSAIYARVKKNRRLSTTFDYTKEEVNYWGHGVTRQMAGMDEVVEDTRFMVVEGCKEEKVRVAIDEVEKLAHQGLDAKQILNLSYPGIEIGLTTVIPSKIIR